MNENIPLAPLYFSDASLVLLLLSLLPYVLVFAVFAAVVFFFWWFFRRQQNTYRREASLMLASFDYEDEDLAAKVYTLLRRMLHTVCMEHKKDQNLDFASLMPSDWLSKHPALYQKALSVLQNHAYSAHVLSASEAKALMKFAEAFIHLHHTKPPRHH